jgi:hypothetical protein
MRVGDVDKTHSSDDTASRKKIVAIEGEKVATPTTWCRMRGCVLFRHRYHPMPESEEAFL